MRCFVEPAAALMDAKRWMREWCDEVVRRVGSHAHPAIDRTVVVAGSLFRLPAFRHSGVPELASTLRSAT